MDMQQPKEQVSPQAIIDALVWQRNDALNSCAQLQALLTTRDAQIAELEKQLEEK